MSTSNINHFKKANTLNDISNTFSKLQNEAKKSDSKKSPIIQQGAKDLIETINNSNLSGKVKNKLTGTVKDMLSIAQNPKGKQKWDNNLKTFSYTLYVNGGSSE